MRTKKEDASFQSEIEITNACGGGGGGEANSSSANGGTANEMPKIIPFVSKKMRRNAANNNISCADFIKQIKKEKEEFETVVEKKRRDSVSSNRSVKSSTSSTLNIGTTSRKSTCQN